jgi:hypothetical protein
MPRWPIEDVKLSELHLDLANVRIPTEGLDESAIANYLMEAAHLQELIGGILRDGYVDNELPVVAIKNGRYVVLEGNRRVAALKAIHNPSLLSDAGQKKVERLLSRFPGAEMPTQIRVMVAPSREAAQPLLARLHTRNPKESWIREQQAVFYHSQLSTMTVDQLRARYPSETAIPRFIRMGEMWEVIRRLPYDDRELEEFVKTNQLPMSSLEYAYAKPKIQHALGLAFNKDGLLASKRMSEGQRIGLMYLLGRFKGKTLHTRSPELMVRSSEHEQFAEELRRLVTGDADATVNPERDEAEAEGPGQPFGSSGGTNPATQNGAGSGNQGSGHDGGGATGGGRPTTTDDSGSGGTAQTDSRRPNRGETRPRLNIDGFVYRGSSDGLRRRIEELRSLDVHVVPNATFDLLRTILECAIKVYFTAKGQPLTGNNIMLSHCIDALARDYQNDRRMTSLISAVNRRGRMPADQFSRTQSALNASNHEPDLFVSGREVHEAWEHMKPILIEIVGS